MSLLALRHDTGAVTFGPGAPISLTALTPFDGRGLALRYEATPARRRLDTRYPQQPAPTENPIERRFKSGAGFTSKLTLPAPTVLVVLVPPRVRAQA